MYLNNVLKNSMTFSMEKFDMDPALKFTFDLIAISVLSRVLDALKKHLSAA